MQLLSNFDIYSDFYSDPQLKTIFKEEYELPVSSKVMWALMLYSHPESKYYSLDRISRLQLIESDYLAHPLLIDEHASTIKKIEQFLLTKPQRLLKSWEEDLEERDQFMKSLPYNHENFDIKEKLMTNRLKMWEQYLAILKKVNEESDSQAFGDTELSLIEKGVL